jgi:hypothetical protein
MATRDYREFDGPARSKALKSWAIEGVDGASRSEASRQIKWPKKPPSRPRPKRKSPENREAAERQARELSSETTAMLTYRHLAQAQCLLGSQRDRL